MRSLYKNEIEKEHFEIRKIVLNNNFNFLINKLIPRDSIVTKLDSSSVLLNFKDVLQVLYTDKEPSSFYIKGDMNFGLIRRKQISQLKLSENSIKIFENGSYYDGTNLINSGYWSWSEKVSNLLPLDYLPETNQKNKK